MKYMVISDIHGGIYNLDKVLDIYVKEHCFKLLILGDLFNYGFDLNREDIVNRLNLMRENIIAVSGNCDNNIKGILFDMPFINNVVLNNKKITITHGHLYNKEYLLNLDTDIVLVGHSHIPVIEKIGDIVYCNPGSITKSRSGDNSFIIVDENKITIRALENMVLEEVNI